MDRDIYRYVFGEQVAFDEVLATLNLSLIAVESLHGESRARLDARFADDSAKRVVVIDAGTLVGRALNEVFTGYVRREFGERSFRVERADRRHDRSAVPASASASGAAA